MDFGIAKLEGTQLTKTGMMVGTVQLHEPRAGQGDRKLDRPHRHLLRWGSSSTSCSAGERPFQGDSVTSQVLYKIVKRACAPPLDLSHLLGETGRRADVGGGAGARQETARSATRPGQRELADDLQKVLDDHRRESERRRVGTRSALADRHRSAPQEPAGGPGRRRPRRPAPETIVAASPGFVDARSDPADGAAGTEGCGVHSPRPPSGGCAHPARERPSSPRPRRLASRDRRLQPTVLVAHGGPSEPRGAPRYRCWQRWAPPHSSSAVVGYFHAPRGRVGAAWPAPVEVRDPGARSLPLGAAVLVDGRDSGIC